MTIEELNEKYSEMCDSNEDCDFCRYNRENCLLAFGYKQGRAELKKEYDDLIIGLTKEEARRIKRETVRDYKIILFMMFKKYDKEHGYPCFADIREILDDAEIELKEGEAE